MSVTPKGKVISFVPIKGRPKKTTRGAMFRGVLRKLGSRYYKLSIDDVMRIAVP